MSDTERFHLNLLGAGFLIETDEPSLLTACLNASYGSACRSAAPDSGHGFSTLILRHKAANNSNGTEPLGRAVALEGGDGKHSLYWNRQKETGFSRLPPVSDPDALRLVFAALAAFVHSALKERNIYFAHASAAEWNGGAILFAGPNECGKSTLMRELLPRGAKYLADDAAPVALNGGRLELLPSPEVISAVGLGEDAARSLIVLGFRPGPDPRFFMPPAFSQPAPARAIFFPEFGESFSGPVSLTKKEAMLKILKLNKTPLSDGEGEGWFKAAAGLAEQAVCARLAFRRGALFPIEKVINFCDCI
ncbi:MAG: hypothetical protein WCX65_08135 [bacterium]